MNLYERPAERLPQELTEILFSGRAVRIERIVSDHHTYDWYDQAENEWVCLLEGKAELELDGQRRTLEKGDFLLIPSHLRHRVTRTTQCVWLCFFFS